MQTMKGSYEVSGVPFRRIAQRRMSRGFNRSTTTIVAPQLGHAHWRGGATRVGERASGAQQFATDGNKASTAPIRKEPEMADFDETSRQHVQEKSAKELIRADRHLPLLAAVSVIPISKRDLAIFESD
jgi:hypothetical protein